MWKSSDKWLLIAVLCAAPLNHLRATGDDGYGRPFWLDTGHAIDASPEFFWGVELRQLAASYTPPEKALPTHLPPYAEREEKAKTLAEQGAQADAADFSDAIKQGRIKPANASAAESQHRAARQIIDATNEATTTDLPAEEPSEFADYHKGAYAFRQGEKHYPEAREAWEALLKRPAAERHYRTVWATFMIGKLAVYSSDPEAVSWFQKVRKLAAEGFADSAGLAADSYGWAAKSELDQDHREQAAKLYLTQLSLGDESALISLKALVPDRGQLEGTLSFDVNAKPIASESNITTDAKEGIAPAVLRRLDEAARSPVLRSIVTAHVLATQTVNSDQVSPARCLRWLEALEKTRIKALDDADRLGWVAYTAGRYDEAKRWLQLQKTDTATSLWLQSKLARRAGKGAEAVKLMAAAVHAFGPVPQGEQEASFQQASHGDMAVLRLSQADFTQALDEFIAGDLSGEACYLVEQVLTADEVIAYVQKHFPQSPTENSAAPTGTAKPEGDNENDTSQRNCKWMWRLLAHRLVREDRYKEARTYLSPEEQKELDQYVALLEKSANAKLPKMERARAWFDAAEMVHDGGEQLMGYQSSPVETYRDRTPIPGASMKGKLSERDAQDVNLDAKVDSNVQKPTVTAEEKKRIAKHKAPVFKGGFIRHVTSVLMWKAAELLPDQSEELADVLNTGGNWIKGDYRGDDAMADKFFQAIERRASKTALGKEAGAKHWLVDRWGPWSVAPKGQ